MSKKPKEIRLGLLYLGRGEYSKVIRLLEPKIPLFVENKEFYSVLARAFFYTGDYAGAKLYFDRGQKILWDIDSALYTAVLGIKRRDYNSSLRIWLDILDEEPDNRLATKGLETLKKYSTMDELENFIHSKKIDKLVPRRKYIPTTSTIISLSVIIFLLLSTFAFFKFNYDEKIFNIISGENVQGSIENRDGSTFFSLNDFNDNYLDFYGESIYTFSSAQVEEYFNTASKLFNEEKDNMVLTYLNLIKYSNANENIKKKAKLLEGYLVMPDWTTYSDKITFSDVQSNLYQYENCIVKWKGRLTNLDIADRKINFSFLVGYDNGKVLEGVVPVELNENIKIQENQPIEVLGRVILRDKSFYLEALTVMQYIIRDK